jgi:uncharacterized membrane protein
VAERLDRREQERAWVAVAVGAVLTLALASLTFTRQVYDRFVWQFFWGPVFADANNAVCAVKRGGSTELLSTTSACSAAQASGAIVAEPGYTFVSEAGYAVTLVFMLIGVLFLLRRLGVGQDRSLFFALVPFMFFGGALRVVEDANDAAFAAVGSLPIPYPLNTLIISPLIYFTVFAIALAALVGAVALERRGWVEGYERVLTAVGTVVLAVTLAYLFGLSLTTDYVGLYPQILGVVLVLSGIIAWAVYVGLGRYAPHIVAGVRSMGLVVLFAHAVDGVANVIASDWAVELGLPGYYSAKHPLNRLIVGFAETVLPESALAVIGDSWPFLLVKIIAPVVVIYLFDERVFEDNPRYAVLLLVAIVAVGLGPGTRDMLRATFGI